MKILILTSYTKIYNPPHNCITREDRNRSRAHYEQRIRELTDYGVPAGEMCTGDLHTQLRAGLRQIRRHEQYGQTQIDQYFPSSYYRVDLEEDLVHENDIIVPFDVEPLSGSYGETARSDRVQALMERYDLVFSLLAKYDFLPLQHLFRIQYKVPLILLVARSWQVSVPESCLVYAADLVGQIDGVTKYNYQGAIFRKLCEVAYRDGFGVFEQIKHDPQRLLEIVSR